MREVLKIEISARGVKSLCWEDAELVDWAGGGRRFHLDGTEIPRSVSYSFRFTDAILSPDKQYAVIYEKTGTKGLILRNGKILREINRSFYHAEVYDYPVALFMLPTGKTAIVHCPNHYNEIQIEDIESGEPLTIRKHNPIDFFHSRLQVSEDNRYLISAGWIWHPFDYILIYDISHVLAEPELLDETIDWSLTNNGTEVHNAAFLDNDRLILTSGDPYNKADNETNNEAMLNPGQIGVYRLNNKCYDSLTSLPEPSGRLLPLGEFTLGFYGHPKLFNTFTGETLKDWPDLQTGEQNSSICMDAIPPLALDGVNKRFAVADGEKITVVQLR